MDVAESLGQLALFADLSPSQLEAIAHSHDEDVFAAGERVLRRGLSGGNFYVILEGEAGIEIDGEERHRLGRGEFFGEISALTGEPPTADVVAANSLFALLQLGVDAAGGRPDRARDERRRVPLPPRRVRARGDRALARCRSRARARRSLCGDGAPGALRRPLRAR